MNTLSSLLDYLRNTRQKKELSSTVLGETTVEGALGALSNLETITPSSYTAGTNVTLRRFQVYRVGKIVVMEVYFDTSSNLSNNAVVLNVPSGLPRPATYYATAYVHSISTPDGMVSLNGTENKDIKAWGPIAQGTYYYALFLYITLD